MAMDSDTFSQLLDTIERFVREKLIPAEARIADEDRVPDEIRQGMRELGLFGLTVPPEYGGVGLTTTEEVQLFFVLGQTSPAIRSIMGTNNGIGSQGIVLDGTEEQKQKYLPKLASGEMIGSFALTEPESGSDAASLKTSARRDGNGYILNGTKRFITNAPHAGLFTVMARTDLSKPGADGISAFLVEAGLKGLTIGKIDKKMGQKGAHTADVIFEDCRVPGDALLGGKEGMGFKTAMKVLDRGRLSIASVCVGVAERLIRDSVNYALERKQFGKPIADFQLIQAMLADSRTECYAARSMVMDAAVKRDAGQNVSMEASCCKYYASEMVGRVADRAVQIYGGAGYIADYGVERFYRDVRLFRLYEGTSQIQQLVIARHMLREAQRA
jgi:acyl-CoA dehydrogenase